METVEEKLKELVARYLVEFACPESYAEDIVGGILENFVVSAKQPPQSPSGSENSFSDAPER